jgi:hypothetical protein
MQVYPLIPESALFNQLVMQERELDNQIKRQRLAIQAASAPYDHPVMKRLRTYIFATHAHQPAAAAAAAAEQDAAKQQQQQLLPRTSSSGAGQQPGSSSSSLQEPPQWTLNLWGRLVDLNDPPAPADSVPAALLAAMQVRFVCHLYPSLGSALAQQNIAAPLMQLHGLICPIRFAGSNSEAGAPMRLALQCT